MILELIVYSVTLNSSIAFPAIFFLVHISIIEAEILPDPRQKKCLSHR